MSSHFVLSSTVLSLDFMWTFIDWPFLLAFCMSWCTSLPDTQNTSYNATTPQETFIYPYHILRLPQNAYIHKFDTKIFCVMNIWSYFSWLHNVHILGKRKRERAKNIYRIFHLFNILKWSFFGTIAIAHRCYHHPHRTPASWMRDGFAVHGSSCLATIKSLLPYNHLSIFLNLPRGDKSRFRRQMGKSSSSSTSRLSIWDRCTKLPKYFGLSGFARI